jgi:hypothetical protein
MARRTRAGRWVLRALIGALLLSVALFVVVAYLSQSRSAALDECLWNHSPGATGAGIDWSARIEWTGGFPPRYECRYDEYDSPGPSRMPR